MGLLVSGKYLVSGNPQDPVHSNYAIYAEDGEIIAAGDPSSLRAQYPDALQLGGDDVVVTPGFVDAHQHGRGLAYVQRGVADRPLELWLHDLRGALTADPYFGATWAAIHLLLAGTTTALHSQVTADYDNYIHEADQAILGYAASGLRTVLALDIRDRAFFTYEEDALFLARLDLRTRTRAEKLFRRRASPPVAALEDLLVHFQTTSAKSLVTLWLGPQGPHWCSQDALLEARALANRKGLGLHLHCGETRAQVQQFARDHGMTETEWLAKLGFLGPDVSLAHCVWLTPADAELLADHRTVVVHNPSSNLRLRSGLAPVRMFVDRGVRLALGTDCLGLNEDNSLLLEMRIAASLSNLAGRDEPSMTESDWLSIAWGCGASKALGNQGLGRLEVGRKADLVLMDLESLVGPHSEGLPSTLPELIFHRANMSHIRSVVVDGEILVRDRQYLRLDATAVGSALADVAASSARHLGERRRILDELRPHIVSYLERLSDGERVAGGRS